MKKNKKTRNSSSNPDRRRKSQRKCRFQILSFPPLFIFSFSLSFRRLIPDNRVVDRKAEKLATTGVSIHSFIIQKGIAFSLSDFLNLLRFSNLIFLFLKISSIILYLSSFSPPFHPSQSMESFQLSFASFSQISNLLSSLPAFSFSETLVFRRKLILKI